MILLVALWVAAGGLLLWHIARSRNVSSGIAVAYVVDLSLIHLAGGMIYAFPWYTPFSAYLISQGNSFEHVYAGFLQAVIGIWAFVLGVIFLSPFLVNFFKAKANIDRQFIPHSKLPITYLKVSLIINFLIFPIFKNAPSFSALFRMSWYLIIVSISLLIWQSYLQGRKDRVLAWLQRAGVALPFLTVIMDGFLGFGIRAFMSIFVFYLSVFHMRKTTILKLMLLAYLGLSLFVSYMQQREMIRSVLWYENSKLERKIEAVSKIFIEFQFFNPKNNDHLEFIDSRLNQNVLVGQAVEYLYEKNHPFAAGETILNAVTAVIPRILWPGKPTRAGGSSFVTTYTGVEFDESTSVGIGQVMEFYINFGTAGVAIGFLILGGMMGLIDQIATIQLKQGNWQGFAFWFLPGMAMIQSGGSLAEIVMTSAAGFVFILILNKTIMSSYVSKPLGSKSQAN